MTRAALHALVCSLPDDTLPAAAHALEAVAAGRYRPAVEVLDVRGRDPIEAPIAWTVPP